MHYKILAQVCNNVLVSLLNVCPKIYEYEIQTFNTCVFGVNASCSLYNQCFNR